MGLRKIAHASCDAVRCRERIDVPIEPTHTPVLWRLNHKGWAAVRRSESSVPLRGRAEWCYLCPVHAQAQRDARGRILDGLEGWLDVSIPRDATAEPPSDVR